MGEVFLARQEGPAGFSRPAVVKRVLTHFAANREFVQMFLDEARLAGNLAHPNIVQIFELGEADGAWFIAMEYLHGRSLRAMQGHSITNHQPLNAVHVARMISQALCGLQYAHTLVAENGTRLEVVHRDISPDNLFVGFNGVVKVLDFGIAKAANASATTRAGVLKGKSAYMSPEQLRGEKVDGRADIYAVGVVLYELLAGGLPFDGETDAVVINLAMSTLPVPLNIRAPEVSGELCAMVMKALEKKREDRWQTAGEFSNALDRFILSTGELNTNASTAAYLKGLFGEVAPEDFSPPEQTSHSTDAAADLNFGPTRLRAYPVQSDLLPTEEPDFVPGPPDLSRFELSPKLAPGAPAPVAFVPPPDAPLELDRPVRIAAEPEQIAPPPDRRRFPAKGLALVAVIAIAVAAAAVGLRRPALVVTVADVVVRSEPTGAALRIGDDAVGKTPWSGSNVWVGEVRWELTAPGHHKKSGTFKGGDPVQLNVTLQKK